MLVGIAAGLATPRIRDESNIADGFVLVTFAVMACRTRYGKVPREWNVKTWPQLFPLWEVRCYVLTGWKSVLGSNETSGRHNGESDWSAAHDRTVP